MAGDTGANKSNTNNRQGVQLSRSAKSSVGAVEAARKTKGPVKKRIEANERAKRAASRVFAGR